MKKKTDFCIKKTIRHVTILIDLYSNIFIWVYKRNSKMSVGNDWDSNIKKESTLRSSISPSWTPKSSHTPRSTSPPSCTGEDLYSKYIDIINSKSNVNANERDTEPPEHPFDFFDDEEFAFGISLLNNNVACVGDNITKLVQMGKVFYT